MSLPGRWRWRDRPIFRKARFGHCVCNIDPPASPYAIMRRACPYRGENRGPGKDVGAPSRSAIYGTRVRTVYRLVLSDGCLLRHKSPYER